MPRIGSSGWAAPARASLSIARRESFILINRGASPLGLPYTLSRAPLRRRAPFAWLARGARSRCGDQSLRSPVLSTLHPVGRREQKGVPFLLRRGLAEPVARAL